MLAVWPRIGRWKTKSGFETGCAVHINTWDMNGDICNINIYNMYNIYIYIICIIYI